MITKILLYAGTILLYEWVVLFAGAIPNLVLGLINNSTGGRFPPISKFAFILNTLPAIAILFVADWIWRITAGCSLPVVILPILAVIHLRNLRVPGANISNKYQAIATVVGIVIFAPIYFSTHGLFDATWVGFGKRPEAQHSFRGLGDPPSSFRAQYGKETRKNIPSVLDVRFSMDTYHDANGFSYRVSYMGDSAELVTVLRPDGSSLSDAELDGFLKAFADGRSWREAGTFPDGGKLWQRDDAAVAKYSTGGKHSALELMTTKTLKLFMVNE